MAEEQRLGDRLEAMDKEVSEWAKTVAGKLKNRIGSVKGRDKAAKGNVLRQIAQLGLKDKVQLRTATTVKTLRDKVAEKASKPLQPSLKVRLRKKGGELTGVGWTFSRHGIFFERGVGKGRPVGSAAANAAARPWLFPTIDSEIESLANLLEEKYADIAAGELRINIPGIYETKITIA